MAEMAVAMSVVWWRNRKGDQEEFLLVPKGSRDTWKNWKPVFLPACPWSGNAAQLLEAGSWKD